MLTPMDVHNKQFRRSLRGYNEEEVDEFLEQLAQDYEWLYMENQRLKEKLDDYENGIKRYEEMEQTIKDTLVMAQKNSEELRENTQKESEVIMNEARQKSQEIVKEAEDKAEQIVSMAEERARELESEAEEKAKNILKEYQWLQKQSRVFRVKFRSFLEAQLNLLEKQENELDAPHQEVAAGYVEDGEDDSTDEDLTEVGKELEGLEELDQFEEENSGDVEGETDRGEGDAGYKRG